jgi:type I restriction enzyme R subunit
MANIRPLEKDTCRDYVVPALQRAGRQEVIEALEARGISFTEAATRTGLDDSDPLDLLVHVAWNRPVITRQDRVRWLRKEHRAWLEAFVPAAREVLDELLTKYAEHGIGELDDLRVLEVPPLSQHGTPVEIAERFGGRDGLWSAVEELESRLYAA